MTGNETIGLMIISFALGGFFFHLLWQSKSFQDWTKKHPLPWSKNIKEGNK